MPEGFGNGRTPDKISAVMIYVTKTPPTLVRNYGFTLDGELVKGVPYGGEPLRGGVRVYLDDKLATIIKRQDLPAPDVAPGADGEARWSLYGFLAAKQIDTSRIVEGWVIRGERRHEELPASQLATIQFAMGTQGRGTVFLGDDKLQANVIALHSRDITAEQLPQILPEEE